MIEIKGFQVKEVAWPGDREGEWVAFLILSLALVLCEGETTAKHETGRWRVV